MAKAKKTKNPTRDLRASTAQKRLSGRGAQINRQIAQATGAASKKKKS